MAHLPPQIESEFVNARVYTNPDSFPEWKLPEVRARANVGVCLSGGGNRASSLSMGVLRALHHLGLLPGVRYLSAVSGSGWGLLPWTYLPADYDEDRFLGAVEPPESLVLSALQNPDTLSFQALVAGCHIMDTFFSNALHLAGHETYSRALGQLFLTPIGMGSWQKFFSWNGAYLLRVLERNPHLQASDFHIVERSRPFWIAGGSLLRGQFPDPNFRALPFEMTALYCGVPSLYPMAGSEGRHIGGGYLESFGFGSDHPGAPPSIDGYHLRVGRPHQRFSLCDVLGITGAEPARALDLKRLTFLGFPEYKYWSPRQPEPSHKDYAFGDGGDVDYLGVYPLLRRRVERIVLIVNSKTPIDEGCPVNESIPPLFGEGSEVLQVFPREKLAPLQAGLRSRRAVGDTVLHRDRYQVIDNEFLAISGGWEVEVLWLYNERVPRWESRLPPELQEQLHSDALRGFPHLETIFQNPPKIIELTALQSTMLSHLACWNVLEHRYEFESMLS